MKQYQSGVALVLVLWVVTLLTVIAGNFSFGLRGEVLTARNQLSSAQARALADAGVQVALYELMKPPSDPLRWQGDGNLHAFGLNGAQVQVRILDESGKIDINTASDTLLKGLLKSAGLSEEQGASLLDAILDWRDPDTLRRANGAEENEYRAAGRKDVPSNLPFETIDELQRVLGMSPELYRKLAPALTVYSMQGGVNTSIAPREVLLSIPDVDVGVVDAYLLQRQSALATGQKAPPFPAGAAYLSMSGGLAFGLRSEARMADGTVFVRGGVVKLTQDPKRPYVMLAWGEDEAPREIVAGK